MSDFLRLSEIAGDVTRSFVFFSRTMRREDDGSGEAVHVLREPRMEGEEGARFYRLRTFERDRRAVVFCFFVPGGLVTYLETGACCLQVFRVPETATVLLR